MYRVLSPEGVKSQNGYEMSSLMMSVSSGLDRSCRMLDGQFHSTGRERILPVMILCAFQSSLSFSFHCSFTVVLRFIFPPFYYVS